MDRSASWRSMAMVLATVSLGALLSCQAGGPAPSPTPVLRATPTAATPSAIAGVLSRPSSPIPQPTFAQLSAPSANVVWVLVAYNFLFRSTDRGGGWEQRPLPPSPVNPQLAFVDDREGWLASDALCDAQQTAIWHTADAGATWESLGPLWIADGQCSRAFSFVDARRGFIAAEHPSGSPMVYRTADGGRTWSPSAPLPDPPGFKTTPGGRNLRLGRVHAFGATLLMTATSASSYVYRSTDGGATWGYLATANALVLVSATRWLEPFSRETTDAGASWHPYLTDYLQAAPVAPAIEFGSEQVGYATVRGTIKRTQDGGAHWVTVGTPGTQ